MAKSHHIFAHNTKIFLLLLTTWLSTVTAQAAAPVGQTIWIRATANGLSYQRIRTAARGLHSSQIARR